MAGSEGVSLNRLKKIINVLGDSDYFFNKMYNAQKVVMKYKVNPPKIYFKLSKLYKMLISVKFAALLQITLSYICNH